MYSPDLVTAERNRPDGIKELMATLFLIAAGYAIYLILVIFCLRFMIEDQRRRRTFRFLLFAFVIISIVGSSIFFLVTYSEFSLLLICVLGSSDDPQNRTLATGGDVNLCENPQLGGAALSRFKLAVSGDMIINTLADFMLLYRACVIWQWRKPLMAVTVPLFAVAAALNIYVCVKSVQFQLSDHVLGIVFAFLALSDLTTSSLVIGRLLYHCRAAKAIGMTDNVIAYNSLATVFFEASFLTTSSRIIYASVLWARVGARTWIAILANSIIVISPLFVVLRLAFQSLTEPSNIMDCHNTNKSAPFTVGPAPQRYSAAFLTPDTIYFARRSVTLEEELDLSRDVVLLRPEKDRSMTTEPKRPMSMPTV